VTVELDRVPVDPDALAGVGLGVDRVDPAVADQHVVDVAPTVVDGDDVQDVPAEFGQLVQLAPDGLRADPPGPLVGLDVESPGQQRCRSWCGPASQRALSRPVPWRLVPAGWPRGRSRPAREAWERPLRATERQRAVVVGQRSPEGTRQVAPLHRGLPGGQAWPANRCPSWVFTYTLSLPYLVSRETISVVTRESSTWRGVSTRSARP
jgi:hypothetical protein